MNKTEIKKKTAVNLEDIDGIKKALNITLAKFKSSAVIITNNDEYKKIYEYVAQTRENQEYHTIPWDLIYDSRFVDSVISEDDCLVAFDLKGQLINLPDKTSHSDYNIFSYKLKDILKFNFKKFSYHVHFFFQNL